MVSAALVALIFGRGLSTLGGGGGLAAVCGAAASGDNKASPLSAGITVGGVSFNNLSRCPGSPARPPPLKADIMAALLAV